MGHSAPVFLMLPYFPERENAEYKNGSVAYSSEAAVP